MLNKRKLLESLIGYQVSIGGAANTMLIVDKNILEERLVAVGEDVIHIVAKDGLREQFFAIDHIGVIWKKLLVK